MKNTILTVVAILAASFPFITVALELARAATIVTLGVYLGIAVVLAVTVAIAIARRRPRQA